MVLLEVQMQPDSGFHGRLSAQSLRFVQRHPRVEHLEVVVITPHHRLKLGPSNPPRRLNLLTLPVRPESELAASSQQILASRLDLATVFLLMLLQGFPELTTAVSSRTSKSW